MSATSDRDIRIALHSKKFAAYKATDDCIVVDELGLIHAKARVDIAVINGCVHGYEIKSSLDTLERLPRQIDLYQQCLGKLTMVAAPRHLSRIEAIVPEWTGITVAERGRRGAIQFNTLRRSKTNPNLDKFQLAHLLWKSEAADLLASFGASSSEIRQPRKLLYAALAERMSAKQLTAAIRNSMVQRSGWRYPQAPA
jgi:hypothetical protein